VTGADGPAEREASARSDGSIGPTNRRQPQRDIVVVGASAGGVEALRRVVGGLPSDLYASIFVVLHMPGNARSMLAHILSRAGPLPATAAEDGQEPVPGRIYVAPPNRHLLLERGRIRVLVGPAENGSRPAIDPLFRSAAHAYGNRVIGVVLSGSLEDGSAGLQTIKRHGGLAVVQDPDDAVIPSMPTIALQRVEADYCVAATEIGPLIGQLTAEHASVAMSQAAQDTAFDVGAVMNALTAPSEVLTTMADAPVPAGRNLETSADAELNRAHLSKREGHASGFTCPECDGSLWEMRDGTVDYFECRINHRYTLESLLSEQGKELEDATWVAINTLEERAALLRKQASRVVLGGHPDVSNRLLAQAEEAEKHAETIRTTLLALVRSISAAAD
jgi:two-component system, chemotaxis family, protein-glutamate methylesterase/glutaminase